MILKKEKESNDDLRRILRTSERSWQLYEDVALNYQTLGDTVSAIAVWKEYAEARPGVYIPVMALARIYIEKKDWVNARIEIDKVLPLLSHYNLTGKYAEVLFWEGLIEFERSNYELAISKFNQSLKQNEAYLDSKYFRAKSFERTGQIKKAIADFKDLKNMGFKDSEALYTSLVKR
jgi:tetratricopeptide (TPR) repeat protein